ncbi:MAG TPA: hypothetical protein VM529_25925 [Gemmata sp.]|nr:hypothetical protein [Gemmata sp.]
MTTREELIRACREAADYCATIAYGGLRGWGAPSVYEVVNLCRYAVARAAAEDAANAPAAAADGEALFANELPEFGGEGG